MVARKMNRKYESALWRRKDVLKSLGFEAHASRSSWSHDLGEAIIFDAWEHQWERDNAGTPTRYPLRTNGAHYSLAVLKQNPRRGHTRWQAHVDLVFAGKRHARAIMPVAIDPSAKPNKGSRGWQPLVIDGHVESDVQGQVWFCADQITKL
jgi:hypothetical protein